MSTEGLNTFFVRTYLVSRKEEFSRDLMPTKHHFTVLSAIWDCIFTFPGFLFKNKKREAQQFKYL